MTAATPAPALRRPMQALDQQRLAHWRWASHEQRCPRCRLGGRCQRGSDLARAAEIADAGVYGWAPDPRGQ